MLAERRGADPELGRNQSAADTVLHEVAVDLRRKVCTGIAQPLENEQAPFVRQRAKDYRNLHFVTLPITEIVSSIGGYREWRVMTITRERIADTERAIRPYVRWTPVIRADAVDFGLAAVPLLFKLELLQHSGSFKPRGAFANLLLRNVPAAGVVAASGGNHGAAVAYAARRLGVKAAIFVPSITSPAKLERIRGYGAHLVVGGERYADALAASEAYMAETGAMPVHAYDQPETLLGQGSVGLELEADAPDVDTILAAVGGGGFIGGIAAWFAGRAKVVAVESDGAPTLHAAFAAGRPVDAPAGGIAADSLAPKRVGELAFAIARKFVAPEVILVSDDEIRRAQVALWEALRVVAEPGGAAAFAALLFGRYRPAAGERIAVLLCGANTTAVRFEG
jgi:threonine dehydratase